MSKVPEGALVVAKQSRLNVTQKLGRQLDKKELNVLYDIVVAIKPTHFNQVMLPSTIEHVTNATIRALSKKSKSEEQVDIHEVMKSLMAAEDIKDSEQETKTSNPAMTLVPYTPAVPQVPTSSPSAPVSNPSRKRNYIFIDSRYRSLENDGTRTLTWTIINNTIIDSPGTINTVGELRNIVGIRIQPITLPAVDSLIGNEYRSATMLIRELGGQSHIAHEGCRFHFWFKYSSVSGGMVNLIPTPDPTDAVFWFNKPITQLDKLTISFGNPIEPVVFDKDRMRVINVEYLDIPKFTTEEPHKLKTGGHVYFSNFKTANAPVNEDIIDKVNSIYGHIITVSSPTTFEIDSIDLSVIDPLDRLADAFNVYFGSKRIMVPLEIIYN